MALNRPLQPFVAVFNPYPLQNFPLSPILPKLRIRHTYNGGVVVFKPPSPCDAGIMTGWGELLMSPSPGISVCPAPDHYGALTNEKHKFVS